MKTFDLRPSDSRHGFTLIEIILVVVVIGLAAGVAIPSFRGGLSSLQMRDAERTTIRLARYARSMSILKQSECVLEFTESRISMKCAGGTNENSAGETLTRKLPEHVTIELFQNTAQSTATSRRRRHDEDKRVRFYPSGMNDGFKIIYSAGGGQRSEIICNPVTAKTTVRN
ncbi:MAG: prepilin-type N-terminal cleavage/methylation domain-containing protein [Kiritimatiellales bacterium]